MPPKQQIPTLKKYIIESSSDSEENETKPKIESKSKIPHDSEESDIDEELEVNTKSKINSKHKIETKPNIKTKSKSETKKTISDSEENETKPKIESNSKNQHESEESDIDEELKVNTKSKINSKHKIETKPNIKTKSKSETKKTISDSEESHIDEPVSNPITLLINFLKAEYEQGAKTQEERKNLIEKLDKTYGYKKPKTPRESPKPLEKFSDIMRKFIGCDNTTKYTFNDLKKEFGKKLIACGNKQIITKKQLEELDINDALSKEQFKLEKVKKDEIKPEVLEKLNDKKEEYYIIQFGKLASIVSCVIKK